MKPEQREQYRRYVEQWKRAGPELERVRRAELRALDTRADVSGMDALADIGLRFGAPRETSGLVEMQWWFMNFARKQGILPATVREKAGPYGPDSSSRGVSPRPKRRDAASSLQTLGNAAIPAGPKCSHPKR